MVLVRLITSPLRRLVQDMWTLSHMDVNAPMPPRSCLSEVNAMVQSFGQLRASLREFRKYMPETLWMNRQKSNNNNLTDSKDCPEPSALQQQSFGLQVCASL